LERKKRVLEDGADGNTAEPSYALYMFFFRDSTNSNRRRIGSNWKLDEELAVLLPTPSLCPPSVWHICGTSRSILSNAANVCVGPPR
jgi:hypothetical protein